MTSVKTILLACAAGVTAAFLATAPATAETSVMGREASECDIAASLNIVRAGCPARARTRGLAIGNADVMPPAPPAPPNANLSPTAANVPVVTPPEAPRTTRAEPTTVARPVAEPPRQEFKAAFQITFEFGSTRITAESREILDRVGAVLNSPTAQSIRFRIVGHTDAVGNAATNLALSERRAAAVMEYLQTQHGIPRSRLEAIGRGESDLLNRTNPNGAENRRVEIVNLGA